MKSIVRHTDPDGEQMFFSYRRTRAERIAAGELQEVTNTAKAAGFPWRLVVASDLWKDIQAVPRNQGRNESVFSRWQHVFTLGKPAVAQIIRDELTNLKINVVLRTSAGPDKSKEHIKHLCPTRERTEQEEEIFILGYCTPK